MWEKSCNGCFGKHLICNIVIVQARYSIEPAFFIALQKK